MTKFSDNKFLGLFHYTHFLFFDHPIYKNDVYFFIGLLAEKKLFGSSP